MPIGAVKKRFFLWILFLAFGMMGFTTEAFADNSLAYDSHGKRDPFSPLVTTASRESSGLLGIEQIDEIMVEGIVYDPANGSVVVLNGTVLKEGEEVGAVKIVQIKPDGVVIALNESETFKTLYQEDTKGKMHEQSQY